MYTSHTLRVQDGVGGEGVALDGGDGLALQRADEVGQQRVDGAHLTQRIHCAAARQSSDPTNLHQALLTSPLTLQLLSSPWNHALSTAHPLRHSMIAMRPSQLAPGTAHTIMGPALVVSGTAHMYRRLTVLSLSC